MTGEKSIKHGTPTGYRKHLKEPEKHGPPCEKCRSANAKEMRKYRENVTRDRSGDRRQRKIRHRALMMLRDEHPRDHNRFLREAELQVINEELEK